ncbi:hypothetical protein ABK040_010960 [Willaertia magna]
MNFALNDSADSGNNESIDSTIDDYNISELLLEEEYENNKNINEIHNLPFDIKISLQESNLWEGNKSDIKGVYLKFIFNNENNNDYNNNINNQQIINKFQYHILSTANSKLIDNRVVRIFKDSNHGNDICKVKFCGQFHAKPFEIILRKGFYLFIGNEKKHFIPFGSSNSSKEELILYFINQNTIGRKELSDILGDFKEAIKVGPAKYASRVGLCFSTSKQSGISIDKQYILEVGDIKNSDNGNITTDGIGYISISTMKEMYGGNEDFPSAIQIRYLGYKGVLMALPNDYFKINDDVTCKLLLYNSMKKFEGGSHYTYIDVLTKSEKMSAALNRILITFLMELTSKPDELRSLFLSIYSNYLNEMKNSLKDRASVFKLLKKYNDEKLDLYNQTIVMMLLAGQDVNNPLIQRTVTKRVKDKIFELITDKFKLKIPFPYACSLIGVVDPSGEIGADEVYVPIDDNMPEYVLVTRHPCTLPNDIRKYKCLKTSPQGLQHLRNVIVFSAQFTKYGNSQADCMSGGDYDGDTYLVIYHDKIVNLIDLERDPLIITKPEPSPSNQTINDNVKIKKEEQEEEEIDDFFERVIDNYIAQSQSHSIEDAHSKLMSSIEVNGTEDPITKKMALYYSLSIDGMKNNFNLEEINYKELKQEPKWSTFCNNFKIPTTEEEYKKYMSELIELMRIDRCRAYAKIGYLILVFLSNFKEVDYSDEMDPDLKIDGIPFERSYNIMKSAEMFYMDFGEFFANHYYSKNNKKKKKTPSPKTKKRKLTTSKLEKINEVNVEEKGAIIEFTKEEEAVLELRKKYFGDPNEPREAKLEKASIFLQYMYLRYKKSKNNRTILSPAVWMVCGDYLNELKIRNMNANNPLYKTYGQNFPQINPLLLKDVYLK